jgi:hypothetical protein
VADKSSEQGVGCGGDIGPRSDGSHSLQREGVLATDLFLQKVKMASGCNNVVKSFMEEALRPYYHVIRDFPCRLRAMQGGKNVGSHPIRDLTTR